MAGNTVSIMAFPNYDQQLTSCISSDVLDCEFQHSGVLHDRRLDHDDPRAEDVCPCLHALSEEPVKNLTVIDIEVTDFLALCQ